MGDLKNFSKLQVNTRSSHPEVFCKKMFLKILQISQILQISKIAKKLCKSHKFCKSHKSPAKRLCLSPFFNEAASGKLKLSEAATGTVLLKKVFLKRRTGVSEPAVYTPSTQNRCF